ncbi:MAG TPA: sensor domain-containing protein [Mycobacteriales bacterium]|nr:sensor domain-containing protein [Mycobacteriales bacterium]
MSSPTLRRPAGIASLALRAPFSGSTVMATMAVATSAVLGTASFIILLPLLLMSVPLMILALVGMPLLWIALAIAHGLAWLDAKRMQTYLGRSFTVPPRPGHDRGFFARQWLATRSRRSWIELAYGLIVHPLLSWICAGVVFLAWGGGIAYLLFPSFGWTFVSQGSWSGMPYALSSVLHVLIGLAALLTAPWLARWSATIQLQVAKRMLQPSDVEVLENRVESLEDTRSRMVAAADAERRRIERDLHDGAQQRLVALAMALGRAKARLDEDPAAARVLVDEAHGEAKLALTELRNLARGIHPAVLTDRGLDPALSALAERMPIPVEVRVDVPIRPSQGIEAVAYFVVAEALTNVTKHAAATRASVIVTRVGTWLRVDVVDDGVGGADMMRGSGIAGLRDRARAVDGDLTLTSPVGGPTTIRVELPCV